MFQYTIWWSTRASTAVGSTMWRQSQHQRHSYARRGNFNHLLPTWRGYTYQLLLRHDYNLLHHTMTRLSVHYYQLLLHGLQGATSIYTTPINYQLRGEPINYQSTTTLNYVQSSQTITMRCSSSSLRLIYKLWWSTYNSPTNVHYYYSCIKLLTDTVC